MKAAILKCHLQISKSSLPKTILFVRKFQAVYRYRFQSFYLYLKEEILAYNFLFHYDHPFWILGLPQQPFTMIDRILFQLIRLLHEQMTPPACQWLPDKSLPVTTWHRDINQCENIYLHEIKSPPTSLLLSCLCRVGKCGNACTIEEIKKVIINLYWNFKKKQHINVI